MQAGRLNRRLKLQRPTTAIDALGQPIPGWEDMATVWASVRHPSGLETVRANAEQSRVQASIRIRWRTDVNSAMRLVTDTQVYSIKAVLPDASRQYVDLACEVTP